MTYSELQHRGWRSPTTLDRAKKTLLELGFIQQTRQGGKNRCSLYALTWYPIHDCKGKLEVKPTLMPSSAWKDVQ